MEIAKMEQTASTTKRKRVAKNRKKAWRKHSNIQDVEDFMDDQRMQLRTGGLVSEKPDEKLFFVDNQHPSKDEDKKNLDRPLKIDRKLMPDPRIPVARISKTPRSSERPKRKSKLMQKLEDEDKWGPSSTVKRRKLTAALKDSDKAEKVKDDDQKRRESGRAVYDIWGDPAPTKSKTEATPNEHFLRVTKRTRKKLPKTYYEKTSCFNAVEVVPAGASYNPTFEDHQELIQKAVQVEVDREKKEEKLNRWHRFAKVSRAEMERSSMKEMTEGLFDEGHKPDEEEEGDGEEEEDVLPSAPVVAERRKTRKQRNKEKEIKEQVKKAQSEKKSKIRLHEVYRLRSLKREIKEKEEKIAAKIKEKKTKADENEGKTKRLGRYKYEELPIPVKLSEHLVGNLRRLKPEGSLIVDRFNNLQKRNMIEPRIWKKGMKPKMKEYEKKTFKEIKTAV